MTGTTEVTFNQKYLDTVMRSAPVEAFVRAKAEEVLATAQATAPVRTGAYRNGLTVAKHQAHYRDAYRVEGTDKKTLLIEAKTGNLARALQRSKK